MLTHLNREPPHDRCLLQSDMPCTAVVILFALTEFSKFFAGNSRKLGHFSCRDTQVTGILQNKLEMILLIWFFGLMAYA